MSGGRTTRPTPVVRLRHTVRVELRTDAALEVRKRFGWDWVLLRVLRDFCRIPPSRVLCLQDFAGTGFLDITFAAFSDCSAFFDQCSRQSEEEVILGLRLVPLFAMDEVPLIVHMYNPFVTDEDIRAFLSRYCSSVSAGEKIRGRFGVWNGKRRFRVKLKVDPAAPGGLLHRPGSFSIGPHRGFLHYPGQPLYCRRCGALGHTKEGCTGGRCHTCGSAGHVTTECGAPKTCSLCGSEQHLYRQCPSRQRTFASLFSEDFEAMGGPGEGQQEEAEVAQTVSQPAAAVGELVADVPLGQETDEAVSRSQVAESSLDGRRPTESSQSVSWAEALDGLEASPSRAQTNWATMVFSNDLEESNLSQEQQMVEEAGPSCSDPGKQSAAAIERGQKRSRFVDNREFELCAVEETGTEECEGEEVQGGRKRPTHFVTDGPGVSCGAVGIEEERWTQVRARRARGTTGKGRDLLEKADEGN